MSAAGSGNNLEQKVRYTGQKEDNGKVVSSFLGEMCHLCPGWFTSIPVIGIFSLNQVTCLALQSYAGDEIFRNTADLRLS